MSIFLILEFWLAIALAAFLGLLLWKGLKPAIASLDKRAERIRQAIDEAETLREDAEKMLADNKRRQREALSEAEHIIEHAKLEAKHIAEQAAKDLELQLARREQMAMDKIAQAEAAALTAVRNQAVDVAIAATTALLRRNLDQAAAGQLIDQSLDEVARKLN